jgi:hypothetical protein
MALEAAPELALEGTSVHDMAVAQVTLDHFVMVRIHARQPIQNQALTN